MVHDPDQGAPCKMGNKIGPKIQPCGIPQARVEETYGDRKVEDTITTLIIRQ